MMMDPEAQSFYKETLELLYQTGVNFLLGGGFAVAHYTGMQRETKDMDIFIKLVDCPKVLKYFAEKGVETELTDVRWLAKIRKKQYYSDLIFNSVHNICIVDESWFQRAAEGEFCGIKVKMVPIEELIWCKSYVWNRERFDGADINHLILKQGEHIDWKHLLQRLDPHWHILLAELIMFQFVYPSEYQRLVPKWLFDDLISRVQDQWILPGAVERVCRGPIIDSTQYHTDIREWHYLCYTIKTV
jgi:predicted nucleotidyltransferase